MIELAAFLLKHLYELMADDYTRSESVQSEHEVRYRTSLAALIKREQKHKRRSSCHLSNAPNNNNKQTNLTQHDHLIIDSIRVPIHNVAATTNNSQLFREIQEKRNDPTRRFNGSVTDFEDEDESDTNDSEDEQVFLGERQLDYDDQDEHNQYQNGASAAVATIAQSSVAPTISTNYQHLHRSQSEQETNQQIVLFLANNHIPDLICETFIELLFISVFMAITWIFVMILHLHCQSSFGAQLTSEQLLLLAPNSTEAANQNKLAQPTSFYCDTKFLSALMYSTTCSGGGANGLNSQYPQKWSHRTYW